MLQFSAPERNGHYKQPPKADENTPDVVAVGPNTGEINPVISLRVIDKEGKTFDDFIKEKNELLQEVIDTGSLVITSQENVIINGKDA